MLCSAPVPSRSRLSLALFLGMTALSCYIYTPMDRGTAPRPRPDVVKVASRGQRRDAATGDDTTATLLVNTGRLACHLIAVETHACLAAAPRAATLHNHTCTAQRREARAHRRLHGFHRRLPDPGGFLRQQPDGTVLEHCLPFRGPPYHATYEPSCNCTANTVQRQLITRRAGASS